MPHVLEDPDVLEEHTTTLSPEYDELHALPHERSHVMTVLRRLFTPVPRLRTPRKACGVAGTPRVETALDVLAREHPDIHLRLMGGIG
jgi:hypothetical protein